MQNLRLGVTFMGHSEEKLFQVPLSNLVNISGINNNRSKWVYPTVLDLQGVE